MTLRSGGGRYAAEATKMRNLYIPPVSNAPVEETPSEFRKGV